MQNIFNIQQVIMQNIFSHQIQREKQYNYLYFCIKYHTIYIKNYTI
jgi:hypothetical protein